MTRSPVVKCRRCPVGREKPAQTLVRYALGDNHYEIDLCEAHDEAFTRELMVWIRMSVPVENTSSVVFTRERTAEHSRAAELRSEQVSREKSLTVKPTLTPKPAAPRRTPLSPAAQTWGLSAHAISRAQERGYDLPTVLATAAEPQQSYVTTRYGTNARIHQRGECAVAVDVNKKIVITVLHRDESRYQQQGA